MDRDIRTFFTLTLTLLFGLLTAQATAAPFIPEKAMEALLRQDNLRQIERTARERIANNSGDEVAHHYLVRATVNDRAKRSETISMLERCVERNPKSALCQHGLGMMLGANAADAGILNAMGSLGRIKDALFAAVELAPDFYAARRDAVQFYLQAPGIVGGSTSKAKALAGGAPSPEQQTLLRAIIANYEKRPEDAEKLLASVNAVQDDAVQNEIEALWINVAQAYNAAKLPAKAKQITERLVVTRSDRALVHYQHATMLLANNETDTAADFAKSAARLDVSANLPIDWLIGRVFEAKGDKVGARAAYERALKWPLISDRLRKNIDERLTGLK